MNQNPRLTAIEEKAASKTYDFGGALALMKDGLAVRRRGWNGKGIFIRIQQPDALSQMTHPYIYIDTTGLETNNPDAPKDRVPWLASQTDVLAEDWEPYIVQKTKNTRILENAPDGN